MTVLRTIQTTEGLAVVLNEDFQELLGVNPGGDVNARVSDAGEIVITGQDMSHEARRERGRALIARYQKTFEALAK